MSRWLVPSEKETVTPDGAWGSDVLEPKFNPMAKSRVGNIGGLICTQLVDGVPDVGDDDVPVGAF